MSNSKFSKKHKNVLDSLIADKKFEPAIELIRKKYGLPFDKRLRKLKFFVKPYKLPKELEELELKCTAWYGDYYNDFYDDAVALGRAHGLDFSWCRLLMIYLIYDYYDENESTHSDGLEGFHVFDINSMLESDVGRKQALFDYLKNDYPVGLMMSPDANVTDIRNYIDNFFDSHLKPVLSSYKRKHSLLGKTRKRSKKILSRNSEIIFLRFNKLLSYKEIVSEINTKAPPHLRISEASARKVCSRYKRDKMS